METLKQIIFNPRIALRRQSGKEEWVKVCNVCREKAELEFEYKIDKLTYLTDCYYGYDLCRKHADELRKLIRVFVKEI